MPKDNKDTRLYLKYFVIKMSNKYNLKDLVEDLDYQKMLGNEIDGFNLAIILLKKMRYDKKMRKSDIGTYEAVQRFYGNSRNSILRIYYGKGENQYKQFYELELINETKYQLSKVIFFRVIDKLQNLGIVFIRKSHISDLSITYKNSQFYV